MRVVVVGGSGAQGSAAVRTVLRNDAVNEIVVASRNPDRVRAAFDSDKVKFVRVDATDDASLTALLSKGDLVLNAAAPFFELGDRVARAAIVAQADYADICDDWEATDDILALDEQARSSGSRLVTGFGGAPGIDNMLAMLAMAELDRVEEIVTAWPLRDGGGAGQIMSLTPYVHLLQCAVGPIRLMRDGRMTLEEPLRKFQFKDPETGERVGFTIGSPEAITLHRAHASCRLNLNLMFADARTIDFLRSLAENVRVGNMPSSQAATLLASPDPSAANEYSQNVESLLGWASGVKAGSRVAVSARLMSFPSRPYTAAGVALGLAARFRANAAFGNPGANSVEDVLQPMTYLNALAKELGGEAVVRVSRCGL